MYGETEEIPEGGVTKGGTTKNVEDAPKTDYYNSGLQILVDFF